MFLDNKLHCSYETSTGFKKERKKQEFLCGTKLISRKVVSIQCQMEKDSITDWSVIEQSFGKCFH